MDRIERSFLRNVFSSWWTHGLRLAITFMFVPYLAGVLGGTRYGTWVILFQIVNYFTLFDFGLGPAITRYVSKHLGRGETTTLNRTLNTASLVYLVAGLLAFLGVLAVAEWGLGYLRATDAAALEEGRQALLLLGLYLGVSLALHPLGNSLGAFHRYDLQNLLGIIEEVGRVLVMVWLLGSGHGLAALAATIVAFGLVRQLSGLAVLRKIYPNLELGRRHLDRATAATLLRYSRPAWGISLCWLVIFNTDSVVLGYMSSAAVAGVYYPAAQLLNHLRVLINGIGTALLPAVSHLETTSGRETVARAYLRLVAYTTYASFFVCVGIVWYAPAFVALWLPPGFAGTAPVMIVLAAGAAFMLPQITAEAVLFGTEQHRRLLRLLAIETVAKVILAALLVPRYQALGMALACAGPQVALYATLYPATMADVLGLSPGRIVLTQLRHALAGGGLAAVAGGAAVGLLRPEGWPALALALALTGAAGLGLFLLLMQPGDRNKLLQWFGLRRLRT